MKKIHSIYMTCILLTFLSATHITAAQKSPDIISEAAVLMDGTTGQILYTKNPYATFAPASITKLMTALLTVESLSPEDEITFSRNAVMSIERGSSHIGMRENETISVEHALHGLLLQSANEVANALAEEISGTIETFADDMNSRAAELGAKDTHFVNPNGLYELDHYTTAYDMALITKELLLHDYFLEVMSHSSWQIPPTNLVDEIRYLHQSHKLLNPKKDPQLYREDAVAGKSGYTTKSGYTLVTVARQGTRTLIAVSLKTDANHLYSDTNALLDYGFEAFETLVITPEDFVHTQPIIKGTTTLGMATIAPSSGVSLQVPKGTKKEALTFRPTLPTRLSDDLSDFDVVGDVVLLLDEQPISSLELIVTNTDLKNLQSETPETDSVKDNQQALVKESNNTWKIIWAILLLLLVLAGSMLVLFHKSKQMTYSEYKKQRDNEA